MSYGQKLEFGGRDESQFFRRGRIFKFFELRREFGFFLRFFSGGDGFAKRARMFAVKRFDQRVRDRTGMKIFREHRRPCDRLQRGPMSARRREQRDNHQDMAKSDEHKIILVKKFTKSI